MCLTGNKGWVKACSDTLAQAQHTCGIKRRKTPFSVAVGSCNSMGFFFEHQGVCTHATVSKCLCVASPFAAAGSSPNWELNVGKL